MFLLWFGWFGFNPGSTLGVGDGSLIARVAINTNLAAAAGAIAATATVWIVAGKPDLTMGMNGALAGLVAITAGCAFVEPGHAILIGLIGGVIVVFGVLFLDRHGVDDPVGAIAVHGMNGIWGTLAVGIWGQAALGVPNDGLWYGGGFAQLGIQLLGTVTVSVFIIVVMGLIFKLIDVVMGLRVPRDEELKGLDVAEHGADAYGGFQVFSTE
jgi:Amt family ammonium transporter